MRTLSISILTLTFSWVNLRCLRRSRIRAPIAWARVRSYEHLVWDDWNQDHIARHDVTQEEVEQVTNNEYVFFPSFKERVVVIGLTDAGRALHITLASRAADTYYIITARVADRKERAYYQQHKDQQEVSV
jgi:uncharacterized protein